MSNHQCVSIMRHIFERALCVIFLCFVTASIAAAQTFTVAGNSGGRWVDTGKDFAPGALVQLAARGQVNVGLGGSFGPEGTLRFTPGSGYPAETPHRFGLVARLTNSRTNSQDALHEDWAYGDQHDYCAHQGGHLWLTVNDYAPGDNSGSFTVTVSKATCTGVAPTGEGAGVRAYTEPDRERGNTSNRVFRLNDRVVLKVENDTPDPVYYYNRITLDQVLARSDGLDVQRKEGDQWVEAVNAVARVMGQPIVGLGPGWNRTLFWPTDNYTRPGTYRQIRV